MNFDAISAGNMSSLVYLGREIKKPKELKLLITFENSFKDISSYKHQYSSSTIQYDTTAFTMPMASDVGFTFTDADFTQDFTIEFFYTHSGSAQARPAVNFGGWSFGMWGSGASIGTDNAWGDMTVAAGVHHIAVVQESGIRRFFIDGVLKKSASGTQAQVTTLIIVSKSSGRIANLRVVQKALGTPTYFPVPSAPYTGYEPLVSGRVLAPAALLGCWPFGEADISDRSNYAGFVSFGAGPTWTTAYALPMVARSSFPIAFSLGQSIDLSQDFSIEYMFYGNNAYSTDPVLTLGDLTLRGLRDGSIGLQVVAYYNSISSGYGAARWYLNAMNHVALYRKSGDMYIACNGVSKKITATGFTPSGTISTATFNSNTGCVGACNFRFTQTGVGTTSSFPVPTGLYTGSESLGA